MTLAAKYLPNYTFEDYQRWEGDWELIEGVPFAMSPSPYINHQRVERALLAQLISSLDSCSDCEVFSNLDWVISNSTIVRPDILVACDIKSEKHLQERPEITIEILSESTANVDQNLKRELYEKKGVPFYFIVDVEHKKVEMLSNTNKLYKSVKLEEQDTVEIEVGEDKYKLELDFSTIWPT